MKNKISNQDSLKILNQIDRSIPVNLVLSGGGARGVAHIALLEHLEYLGIAINAISGSSAGALVGALYTSGRTPKEILEFFENTHLFRYTSLNPLKAGIFNSSKYEKVINKYVKQKFEDLEIPLYITSTNLQKGQAVCFSKGSLITPLLASCSVPAIFTPIEIEGEFHSDGGIMDNFPISPFIEDSHRIVGSYICMPSKKTKKGLNTILKVIHHSNNLLLHAANKDKFKLTETTIIYPLQKFGTFDTKKINQMYTTAKEFLNKK